MNIDQPRLRCFLSHQAVSYLATANALSMFQFTVVSTGGRNESISIPQSSKVGDLKILVQKSFQQPFVRLVTADGRVLDDVAQSLLSAGLQEKDCLTVVVLQARLVATNKRDI